MKNQGEALVHSTEKMLKDFGDKVPAADKGLVETALADLKTALQGEDKDRSSRRSTPWRRPR